MIRSNDHEVKIGSTTKQLRIARDENGKQQYNIVEDVPNYRKGVLFSQNEWHGGHGKLYWNGSPYYYQGQGIDTTVNNTVTVGVRSTASDNESSYDFVVAALQDDGGSFTDQTTACHNWTADDLNLLPAAPAVDDAYYFRLANPSGISGYLVVSTALAGTLTVVWEYYNGSSWDTLAGVMPSLTSTGSKQFTPSSTLSSVTVNGTAGYWVRLRVSAFTSITTVPLATTFLISSSALYALGLREGAGVTYFGSTGTPFMWSNYGSLPRIWERASVSFGTDIWVERCRWSGDNITDVCAYNNVLYIGRGNSTKWYYTADGTTYTQTDLTDGYAQKFLVAPNSEATASILYFYQTPNEVMSTTDGRTVAAGGIQATSPAYIGETSSDITSLLLHGDRIFVGKEDSLYQYTAYGGTILLIADVKHTRYTGLSGYYNFQYHTSFQGNTYVSVGSKLAEITAYDTVQYVGVLDNADFIGKSGTITGITSDRDYLYVVLDEGTDTHIYKGKPQNIGGQVEWSWCPWIYISSNTCYWAKIIQSGTASTGIYKRLYYPVGAIVRTAVIVDNPLVDTYNISSSGWIRFSYDYGTDPNYKKLYQSIITETFNCSASNYITGYYRKDTDTSATALTGNITTNGINETNLSTALSCNRIQFQVNFTTTGALTSSPPYITLFQAKGVEVPTTTRIHEVTYTLGTEPTQTAKTLRDFLNSVRTSTALVKLADLRWGQKTSGTSSGDYVWVVMQPGYPKEVQIVDTKGSQPEIGMLCRWQEVSYTIS